MNPTTVSWIALAGAIVFELIGTTFLSRSEHITRLGPTLAAVVFYGCSFYLLAQALRTLPLGVAYAIWGGLGIVLTAVISVVYLKQRMDWITMVGIGFIVAGVVIVNAFSKTGGH
ncbi:QacE family quaternary ammonium compound efflux SMR transporter [Pseudomonas floridensis]|uniref:QacE family quaternary ammonium compound efflux SMR transporter n=1 Tax=Pseudomonas floridensis TaxID=1958950 RepID=A0A1X0N7F5_9PSED|nr:multidrug efflux SMR transporter [Pseudomonas floridensis]ORC59681.1 QacE family quaternary ammonium compound efflux SMR transporter [Pseudomonas floridensis]